MNDRKQKLIKLVISEHIRTAKPVSSLWLAEKSGMKVSSATIRNVLAELEEEGYVMHPHTSAGRIPTEKGYKYYLANFYTPSKVSKKEKDLLGGAKTELRDLAKALSELTTVVVFVAFDKNSTYFTGFSSMATQPEFTDVPLLHHLTEVVDQMDEKVSAMYDDVIAGKVNVHIGSDNPISNQGSLLCTRLHDGSVLGLFGPLRMPYENNVARMEYAKEIYEK